MPGTELDLLVVGGGVHGAAIARDAAARGLAVELAERRDLAWGTSSRSSKLAHGGLRYLERLELGLVREALRERDLLLEMAPHLAWPLPFLIPLGPSAPRAGWMVRIGLTLYDLLAGDTPLGSHRVVGSSEAVELAPGLEGSDMERAAEYFDAGMDDARIVVELALDASRLGARVSPRCEAVALLREGERVVGARLRGLSGEREVRARCTALACGPWTDLAAGPRDSGSRRLTLTKGAHVFVEKPLVRGAALLLSAPQDGRVLFVIPWRDAPGASFAGGSLIGTTDTPWNGDLDRVGADADDVRYLLDAVNTRLPSARLTAGDVIAAQAGLRPLVAADDPNREDAPSAISRDWQLDDGTPGLLVVEGGKYTIFRKLAEEVVDRVAEELGRELRPCSTRERLLPGAGPDYPAARAALERRLRADGVAEEVARHLCSRYGLRAAEIVALAEGDASLLCPACPRHPHVPAEALNAVRHEHAATVADAMLRRIGIAWWECGGRSCAATWISAFERAGLSPAAAREGWREHERELATSWRA